MRLASTLPSQRHFWRSIVVTMVMLGGMIGGVALAQTPTTSNEDQLPAGPLGEQIGWVIDAANGDVSIANPQDVVSHFSPDYLEEISLSGLIDFAYGLVRTWAPVELTGVTVSDDGSTGVAALTARDGTALDLTVEIDLASGLIANVLLTPVGGTPVASPVASPAAVQAPPSYEDIEKDYTSKVDSLNETGEAAISQLLNGDYQAIVDSFSPELASEVSVDALADAAESFTTNRVHFELADVGAIFDAHLTGESMEGFFYQGFAGTFSLTAQSAQTGAYPSGVWAGTINDIGLELSVSFSGNADTLSATLSIPSQNLANRPLGNMSFQPDRPIGDVLDQRALPFNEESSGYRAIYAWGPGYLVLSVYQANDGTVIGFTPEAQWPLPVDPTAAVLPIQPPLDGAWFVIWGGASEFLNYHAASPQQRHALDIVIWDNGSTFSGDGMEVEDYFAYGQTLYAPVSGEVVAVETGLPNMPPAVAQAADPALAEQAAAAAAEQSPAGNHVVIKTPEGFYVLLAHMRPESATVKVGDMIEAGGIVGLVGNSGNTSEPHIHIHAQTALDLFDPAATGVPLIWNNLSINGIPTENAAPVQGDIIEPVEG